MSDVVEQYYIFAEDRQVYGPADNEQLRQWACDGLISLQTWVYQSKGDVWSRAQGVDVLAGLLSMPTPLPAPSSSVAGLKAGQLRRIRLLAEMSDEQATQFVSLVEKIKVSSFATIVKQGEHGDSMFMLLDGEARVSVRIQGKEDTIAVLGVGDFFGEVALLDQGPRSADVVANRDCILLKLSKENFERIIEKYPAIAVRFLTAMNRFLGGRIRATNEKFSRAQNFARGTTGQAGGPASMSLKKGY